MPLQPYKNHTEGITLQFSNFTALRSPQAVDKLWLCLYELRGQKHTRQPLLYGSTPHRRLRSNRMRRLPYAQTTEFLWCWQTIHTSACRGSNMARTAGSEHNISNFMDTCEWLQAIWRSRSGHMTGASDTIP